MTDGDRNYWGEHARNYDRSMSLSADRSRARERLSATRDPEHHHRN